MPVVLLNFDGFYDHILQWTAVAIKADFISRESAAIVRLAATVDQLTEALSQPVLPSSNTPRDSFDWSVLAPEYCKDISKATPSYL